MIYHPTTPPTDPKALPAYLQSEFQRIAVVMASNVDITSAYAARIERIDIEVIPGGEW